VYFFRSTGMVNCSVTSRCPMGIRMAVFQNINRHYRNRKNLFSPEDDTLGLTSFVFVVNRDSKSRFT
jgi:hypothetical protein